MELPKCNFKGNLAYVESGQEAQEQRLAGCLISCGSFFWEGEGKGENPTAHVLKTFHQTDHSSQPESKSPFCSSYDKYTELWLNGYSELGIWGISLCSTKLSPVERETRSDISRRRISVWILGGHCAADDTQSKEPVLLSRAKHSLSHWTSSAREWLQ